MCQTHLGWCGLWTADGVDVATRTVAFYSPSTKGHNLRVGRPLCINNLPQIRCVVEEAGQTVHYNVLCTPSYGTIVRPHCNRRLADLLSGRGKAEGGSVLHATTSNSGTMANCVFVRIQSSFS